MAVHGAIPKAFGKVSPRYQTPLIGTVIYGVRGGRVRLDS